MVSAGRRVLSVVVVSVLVSGIGASRVAQAASDEVIAFSSAAGALGALSLMPAIANAVSSAKVQLPSRFWIHAGWVLGSASLVSGILMATFAARITNLTTSGFEESPTLLYAAGGSLIGIGLVTLGLTANAVQFAVRRIKLAAYVDRDMRGHLYAGAAINMGSW